MDNRNVIPSLYSQEFDAAKFRGVGLMDKMSANFRSAATGFLLKNPDPEFTALQSYFRSLSKHLVHIEGAALGALQDGNGMLDAAIHFCR